MAIRMATCMAVCIAVLLSGCATPARSVSVEAAERIGGVWVEGIRGAENLLLPAGTGDFYVSDCAGLVHLVRDRKVLASQKIGAIAFGWAAPGDGSILVGAADEDWPSGESRIVRLDRELTGATVLLRLEGGINGMTLDGEGRLWFTLGNMSILRPSGGLWRADPEGSGEDGSIRWGSPTLAVSGLRSPNGLSFDVRAGGPGRLLYTEVFAGVSEHPLGAGSPRRIFGKSRLVEGFDDLCVDAAGRIWVADQPNGFLKCFDPATGSLYRYRLPGFGVASCVRIREEVDGEYLYVTEFKRRAGSREYDGRGVLIIPLEAVVAARGT